MREKHSQPENGGERFAPYGPQGLCAMLGLGPQTRPCLRYLTLVVVATVMVLFYSQAEVGPDHFFRGLVDFSANDSSLGFGKEGFLVWSPSCQIPDVDPYDDSIRKLLKHIDPIVCSRVPPLTYTERVNEDDDESDHILKIDTAVLNHYISHRQQLSCCYSNITRYNLPPDHYNKEADDFYNTSTCINFEKEIKLQQLEEFILVRCYALYSKNKYRKVIYTNMHAVVPIKPNVKVKRKERKTNDDDPSLNVLLLGIDSMSRLNLIRTMPQTVAYLQRAGWLSFRGYNKIGDNTFPNVMGILTGLNQTQLQDTCWPTRNSKLDNCPFVWKDFHNHSFISAYAEDEPTMSTFNYHKTGFVAPPTDYYFRPYMLGGQKYLKTVMRDHLDVCMGHTSTTDHILKYSIDFLTAFRNSLYFALFWLNNFSHNNHNTPGAMDVRLLQFFNELSGTGIQNNTIVVFFSDHGMRFGKIRETFVGWLEERLPFIYFWIPEWFRSKYPEAFHNLVSNKDRLTSPYDLHVTLKDILERATNSSVTNSNISLACPKCKSLFSEEFGDRSCEDAGVSPHWCTCTQYKNLSVNTPIVQTAAKYVLAEIQKKLKSEENSANKANLCAELFMNRVVKARMKVHGEGQKADHDDYIIIFETLPGEALFEATVRSKRSSHNSFSIMGIVSRINSYASHSNCVKDAELKLYCFCLPQ